MALLLPSYRNGYASRRNLGRAENPELWNGLSFAWDAGLGNTGTVARDVSGYGRIGSVLNCTWGPGAYGTHLTYASESSELRAYPFAVTLPMTLFVRFRPAARPPTQHILAGVTNAGDTNSWPSYSLDLNGGNIRAAVYSAGGGSAAQAWPDLDVWSCAAAEFTSTAYRRVWLNGQWSTPNTAAVNPAGCTTLSVGAQRFDATYWAFSGSIACTYIWYGRPLQDTSLSLLASDRFALTRLRPEIFPAAVSGGGGAETYTGTIAGTADRATGAASGTFTAPTYAGSVSGLVDKATAAIAGTFVPPTYSGSCSATSYKATASIAGSYTGPTYSGAIGATAPRTTAAADGTFVVPSYSGSVAGTARKPTSAASGSFVPPAYSGSVSATARRATATASGTFSQSPPPEPPTTNTMIYYLLSS